MPNESQSSAPPQKQEVGGILGWIEKMGNRIPDITMLFICAFVITCIASAILSKCTLTMCIRRRARRSRSRIC